MSARAQSRLMLALHRAGDDDCPPLSTDRLHDVAQARAMTPSQRLAALNDIMLLVDGMQIPPRIEEPVEHGALRL
jgi:hypothetical protein